MPSVGSEVDHAATPPNADEHADPGHSGPHSGARADTDWLAEERAGMGMPEGDLRLAASCLQLAPTFREARQLRVNPVEPRPETTGG